MSLLRDLDYEVSRAIEEALVILSRISQPNYCLLIARTGVLPMLENIGKLKNKTDMKVCFWGSKHPTPI